MKKKMLISLVAVICVVAALGSTGCGGAVALQAPVEEASANLEIISFDDLRFDASYNVSQPQSAEELVRLAVSLSSKGKHDAAANLFIETAGHSGPDRKFRQACLGAAATEQLLAGDYARFKGTMVALKSALNPYEKLNPSREIEVLLLIDECKAGTKLKEEFQLLSRRLGKTESP